jgi:hypothetical protein
VLNHLFQVGCRTTDLSQIDSFRISDLEKQNDGKKGEADKSSMQIVGRVSPGDTVPPVGRVSPGDMVPPVGNEQALPLERFKPNLAALHKKQNWRSAIEIIAEDRIREFLKHPLFLKLINDKWKKFGLRMHLRYRLGPFVLGLILHTTASLMLMSEMENNEIIFGKSTGSMCINVTTGSQDIWQGNDRLYVSVSLRCILRFAYPIWLVWESMNFQTLAMSDLDPAKENQKLSLSDARLFLFRNLEPILDMLSAIALVASGVAEISCAGRAEKFAMAVSSITLFCNFLLCLLPFKVIATMIITIYTILFVDVTTFLIIFVIILAGFSLSVAQLYSSYAAEGPGNDWSVLMTMVSVPLGDGISGVSDLYQTSDLPSFSSFIAYFWVFLCNILLLNFLIATMGDTFTKHKQEAYEIWITPFARKVLKYEKLLTHDQKIKHRYGRPLPSSDRSESPPNNKWRAARSILHSHV